MSLYHGEASSSRFTLLERPMAAPATCIVCGTPNGPVIDFNRSFDFYGAIYFCISCLDAAANVAGLFDAHAIRAGLDKVIADELITLAANLSEITGAENDIMAAFSRFNNSINTLLSLRGVPSEITELAEQNRTVSVESNGTNDSESREDSGQNVSTSDSERSVGVPSDSSDESGGTIPAFTI